MLLPVFLSRAEPLLARKLLLFLGAYLPTLDLVLIPAGLGARIERVEGLLRPVFIGHQFVRLHRRFQFVYQRAEVLGNSATQTEARKVSAHQQDVASTKTPTHNLERRGSRAPGQRLKRPPANLSEEAFVATPSRLPRTPGEIAPGPCGQVPGAIRQGRPSQGLSEGPPGQVLRLANPGATPFAAAPPPAARVRDRR